MKGRCVGIDLGTTYSCVAVWENGSVYVIANELGNKTTPSYVGFTCRDELVGEAAKSCQIAINAKNTIFDAKRIIGRNFSDFEIQQNLRNWPFKVVNNGGRPQYEIEMNGGTYWYSAQEISSQVLKKLKTIAEDYMEEKVSDAVITVPAYFNDAQRQATKEAAKLAGLNVMRIINEPTAAALGYGFDKKVEGEINILVYDLGGGTFDASVLKATENQALLEVVATNGNTHLGGEDFNTRLMEFVAAEFHEKYGIDLKSTPRAIQRLRRACETAKRDLSSNSIALVELEGILPGVHYSTKVTKSKFEEVCADLFEETIESVAKVISDANLNKSQIHEVILVGGSTRIPKLQEMLKRFFNRKDLNLRIPPDEVVAVGAAIMSAALSGVDNMDDISASMSDVIPLSLGVESTGGIMAKIIERNTKVPCSKTETFTTFLDNQTSVTVEIFEGERVLTRDNNFLGRFDLTGIEPAEAGSIQIQVTFEVDADGILNVSATEKSSGKCDNMIVTNEKDRLSNEDITRILVSANRHNDEDEQNRQKIYFRNQLETYVWLVKRTAKLTHHSSDEPDNPEQNSVLEKCDNILKWLDMSELVEVEDYQQKMMELKNFCEQILNNKDADKIQQYIRSFHTCAKQSRNNPDNHNTCTIE